jgi:hydrogenase/urease accessory protein HupE
VDLGIKGWFAGLVLVLCALGCAASWPLTASAHQMDLSNARLTLGDDRSVDVEVLMKGTYADRLAGTKVFDEKTGLVDPGAVAASASPISNYVATHAIVVGKDGAHCRPGPADVEADLDSVAVRIVWSCAEVADPLVYRSTVLTDIEPQARQVVLIGSGATATQTLLDSAQTEVSLSGSGTGLLQVIERYVAAGIQHIFIGYDHIAFLIAIMLWARRLLPIVKIVTAFTIAHSITLSLAALEIVRIPSSVVEPAIAASIVYVAVENFLSRDIERRWRDTFAFGFVHGFGFASALQDFGLPKGALLPALASFNIGVEIGQIGIVSIVLPLLLLLDRVLKPREAAYPVRAASTVYALSGVICVLGGYWFLVRTILPAPTWASILGG